MERLKSAVQGALTKRNLSIALKKEQRPSLMEGMSLRCCQQVIIVISSLNAVMYDQIAKLNERGISACMIQRHRMVSWFTAKEMTLSSYHI